MIFPSPPQGTVLRGAILLHHEVITLYCPAREPLARRTGMPP